MILFGARNQILQFTTTQNDSSFLSATPGPGPARAAIVCTLSSWAYDHIIPSIRIVLDGGPRGHS